MIYQPVATSNERGETVVRRPFVREDVFVRPLVGFSLLAIGALFLYVFFTGGAPHPIGQGMRKVLGWLIVTGVFTLFGLAPAALGLAALLRGDQIVVDPTTETIEHQVEFAHLKVWRRRFAFDQFDAVSIDHWRRGFPVSRSNYVVAAEGNGRRLAIGLFHDPGSAEDLSNRIAALLRLPVRRPASLGE